MILDFPIDGTPIDIRIRSTELIFFSFLTPAPPLQGVASPMTASASLPQQLTQVWRLKQYPYQFLLYIGIFFVNEISSYLFIIYLGWEPVRKRCTAVRWISVWSAAIHTPAECAHPGPRSGSTGMHACAFNCSLTVPCVNFYDRRGPNGIYYSTSPADILYLAILQQKS